MIKKQNDVVAIIPARGGSKGLPGKNIKSLKGKPLISYTIEAAVRADIFNRVVVTTDDEMIEKISLGCGAEIINRPNELSRDDTSSVDVVFHTLKILATRGSMPSIFILLQPTSPLRNYQHIQEAFKRYHECKLSSLLSVCEANHHPYKYLLKNNNITESVEPLIDWKVLSYPRQKLPKAYQINGGIYICDVEDFLAKKSFYLKPIGIYEMEAQFSIDIDTLADFLFAEYLLDINKNNE